MLPLVIGPPGSQVDGVPAFVTVPFLSPPPMRPHSLASMATQTSPGSPLRGAAASLAAAMVQTGQARLGGLIGSESAGS